MYIHNTIHYRKYRGNLGWKTPCTLWYLRYVYPIKTIVAETFVTFCLWLNLSRISRLKLFFFPFSEISEYVHVQYMCHVGLGVLAQSNNDYFFNPLPHHLIGLGMLLHTVKTFGFEFFKYFNVFCLMFDSARVSCWGGNPSAIIHGTVYLRSRVSWRGVDPGAIIHGAECNFV
jgi:hypothetical protein